MKSVTRKILPFVVMALLSSCADVRPAPSAGADPSAPIPLPPAPAGAPSETKVAGTVIQPRLTGEIVRGGGSVGRGGRHATVVREEGGDITLDFANADIRDVIKSVLGDLLKLNYSVDSKVQGTVTIASSRPLKRDAVLPVFERALEMNGLALLRSGDFYQVVTAADAPRKNGLQAGGDGRAGYGVEIVPLKFIGAAEMRRLLDPIAPPGGILQADAGRNLLVVAGSEQERAAMLDDIALFDVDWLAGMSFAVYPLKSVGATQLSKELDKILGGQNSPIKGLVQLVPIDRLNAVLAISPQPRYLEELQGWVDRLDRAGEGVERRIRVYHVQNGRAADLAGVLGKSLGAGGSGGGERGGLTAPGAGPVGTVQTPGFGAPAGAADSSAGDMPGALKGAGEQGGLTITADEVNNSLVIYASAQEYDTIEDALRQLDTVPLQVFLEAVVAEVTLTSDLKYGIQYFFKSGNHSSVLSNGGSSTIGASYPGFSYAFNPGSNIQVVLSALDSITDVKVVSSPQVLVLNNHTATLQVGDQVPIATGQSVSTLTNNASIVNSIQYQDTGVILKVTPRVNLGGMVMMDVSQEVSDVSSTTTSSLNSPTIQQRKLSSTVAVLDGETIALGGLIQEGKTVSKGGIPLLSDIPYLGSLFGTTDNQGNRTELLVLITPHVIENVEKAKAVTSELRRKLDASESLLRRVQQKQ